MVYFSPLFSAAKKVEQVSPINYLARMKHSIKMQLIQPYDNLMS